MLRNIKSFYTRGNTYEFIFALLATSSALFVIALNLIGQMRSNYTFNVTPFALSAFFASLLFSTLMLRGKEFVIPRSAKTVLLVELFISLAISHAIL